MYDCVLSTLRLKNKLNWTETYTVSCHKSADSACICRQGDQ